MVRETRMDKSSLIYPLFVKEGENQKEEIPTMPGQFRYSLDRMPEKLEELMKAGVDKVMFFGIPDHKDEVGSQAYAEDGIVQKALRKAREEFQKEESPECHSLHIEKPKTLLVLAVATSIDALAVGISFACVGYRDLPSVLPPALVIALVSFLLSIAGFLGGILFGRRFNPRAGLVGGVILVAIGAKVLGEHLGLL